jgi:hypothetical protein
VRGNFFFESGALTGCLKFDCRQGIPQESGLERSEIMPGGLSGSIESLEDFGRPLRQPVEQPASEVCVLEASDSGVSGQRVFT